MRLLRRLLPGRDGQNVRAEPGVRVSVSCCSFTEQRPDALLQIVGEASYQPSLIALAGDLGPDGPAIRNHTAVLVREPDNRYDRNAVAVYLLGDAERTATKVGYLSRENATAYSVVFGVLGADAIRTRARMKGGWRRDNAHQAYIGLDLLGLGTPAELLVNSGPTRTLRSPSTAGATRWSPSLATACTGSAESRLIASRSSISPGRPAAASGRA